MYENRELERMAARHPAASAIFLMMSNMMDKSNGLVISMSAIALRLDLNIRTVSRAVRYLSAHKYIKIARTGQSNVYYMNSNLTWKGRTDNGSREQAELHCRVVMDWSEQKE